jgi:hypothetical protein
MALCRRVTGAVSVVEPRHSEAATALLWLSSP